MIHIVLFRPEKPANTGNIIRTCRASNAILHIIGPITFSIDDHALKRAGMDYAIGFPIHYYDDVNHFFKEHPQADVYYLTRYGEVPYTKADVSRIGRDYYFMFGRESTGIPHELLSEHMDRCYRIPMVASARSLNLSNCVALVLYEALRQQNFYGLSTKETLKSEAYLQKEKLSK